MGVHSVLTLIAALFISIGCYSHPGIMFGLPLAPIQMQYLWSRQCGGPVTYFRQNASGARRMRMSFTRPNTGASI